MVRTISLVFTATFFVKILSPQLKISDPPQKKPKVSPQMKLTGRTIGPNIAGERYGKAVCNYLSNESANHTGVCILGNSCEVLTNFRDFQELVCVVIMKLRVMNRLT